MTEVYGSSDDLVCFAGDVSGEVDCYGTDDDGHPGILLVFSDGTVLVAKYGKLDMAMWGITVASRGTLLDEIRECGRNDENSERYSDTALFHPGLAWCYSATEWACVK